MCQSIWPTVLWHCAKIASFAPSQKCQHLVHGCVRCRVTQNLMKIKLPLKVIAREYHPKTSLHFIWKWKHRLCAFLSAPCFLRSALLRKVIRSSDFDLNLGCEKSLRQDESDNADSRAKVTIKRMLHWMENFRQQWWIRTCGRHRWQNFTNTTSS